MLHLQSYDYSSIGTVLSFCTCGCTCKLLCTVKPPIKDTPKEEDKPPNKGQAESTHVYTFFTSKRGQPLYKGWYGPKGVLIKRFPHYQHYSVTVKPLNRLVI